MRLYTFNNDNLQYEEHYQPKYSIRKIVIVGLGLVLLLGLNISNVKKHYNIETEKILLIEEMDSFSEERLINKITSLNFKFPHIVLAQTKQETGHYTSKIFKENHNLFGMKEAKIRINLAKGTQYGHAFYDNWEESIMDYAFWCSTYAYKCDTEEKYYQLLSRQYAEDPNYVQRLKSLITKHNLKEKFNK